MCRSASASVSLYISFSQSSPVNERQESDINQFLKMHLNGFVHPLFSSLRWLLVSSWCRGKIFGQMTGTGDPVGHYPVFEDGKKKIPVQ